MEHTLFMFTRSSSWGSRVIRWGLGEPVSHVAIAHGDYVYHSTFSGITRQNKASFLSSNTVVFLVAVKTATNPVEEVWRRYSDKKYDVAAFLWFAWRVLLLRLVNRRIPSTNPWNDKNKYLCTEFAEIIIGEDLPDTITPFGMVKAIAQVYKEQTT